MKLPVQIRISSNAKLSYKSSLFRNGLALGRNSDLPTVRGSSGSLQFGLRSYEIDGNSRLGNHSSPSVAWIRINHRLDLRLLDFDHCYSQNNRQKMSL
jgi:hypothetical protein